MAESHVVSGLVAKRGELAGEAEHCRRELQRRADEVGQLDATIRLFDPDYPWAAVVRATGAAASADSGRGNANGWCWRSCAMPLNPCRIRV